MSIGKVIGRVAIKVLPDTTDFREKTAHDLRRIEKQLGNLEVEIIPNLDKKAKDKIKQELKQWARDLSPLNVKIDLEIANGDAARVDAELAALSHNRSMKIAPELDNGAVAKVAAGLQAMSGLRYTLGLFRHFREELMNLDKAVPKIGLVAHAIGGLGAFILGASGNLFSLSSSLASIGPAALPLPGILGGIAIGVTTLGVVMRDWNKIFPKFAFGLGKATKSGQAWANLQDRMSNGFWNTAEAPMRRFINDIFPHLSAGLVTTSKALGHFIANLANSGTGAFGKSLDGMFATLAKSIKVASRYTDSFVGIIQTLGQLGSNYLPRLAKWFGDIATKFNNWLSKAAHDGRLVGWVETALVALKDLGTVIAKTSSIFTSISKAATAAGGTTLSSLAGTLTKIAAAAASPGFQHGLTDALTAAYKMMHQITSIAGPALKNLIISLSQNFQGLGPTIGDTIGTAIAAIANALASPAVGSGLASMFDGFNKAVHALVPAMEPLAAKFAVLGKLVGALAANIGVVMSAAIQHLAPIFVGVTNALLPFINALGPFVAKTLNTLGPVFDELGKQLVKVGQQFKPLFDQMTKIVALVAPVVVPVLKILVNILGGALVGVLQGAILVLKGTFNIVTGVVDVLKGLWDVVSGLVTLDWSKVGKGFKEIFSGLGHILLGAIQTAFGAIWAYLNGTVVSGFKKVGVKLLGPLAKPLEKFFGPIEKAAAKLLAKLGPVFEKILGWFRSDAAKGFAEKIISAMESVARVLGKILRPIISLFKTVFEAAFTVVKTIIEVQVKVWSTIFRSAFNILKAVFTLAWNGIKEFLATTLDAIYFVFKGPWDAITGFIAGHMNTIRAGIMLVWDAIKGFIEKHLNVIRARVEVVWEAISGATTRVWNVVRAVIQGAWTAIKTYVTTYVNAVRTVVTNVWNVLKNVSTRLWSAISDFVKRRWELLKADAQIVFSAVRNVVERVWNAIRDVTSRVWDAVWNVIEADWNAIKSVVSGAVDRVRSAVTGAWDTIKSKTNAVWDAIKSAVSTAWDNVKDAVDTGITRVIDKVKEMPTKAVNALAGIATALYQAGASLIQGFIDGITSKFDDVRDKLQGLTHNLTSWKGPAPLDRVLLTPAGELIIDGFIRGLQNKFGAVRQALRGLTLNIAQDASRHVSAFNIGVVIANSMLAGLQSARQQILDGVVSLANEIADAIRESLSQTLGIDVQGDFAGATVQPVALDRRLGGLERKVTAAAKASQDSSSSQQPASIQIDNITIPLEDLQQLQDLEDFLDLLRVRIRQG
jgi:phage-related protein